MRFALLIDIVISTRVRAIFKKMTSFTQILSLDRGTREIINGGRKFSEIKVQKNVSSNVLNRLKFGKVFRKDLSEYREFDHSGTSTNKEKITYFLRGLRSDILQLIYQ